MPQNHVPSQSTSRIPNWALGAITSLLLFALIAGSGMLVGLAILAVLS